MKEDLAYLPRRTSIIDIVDYLEVRYKKKGFNYAKVYREFRKLRPLLGPKDCSFLCQYLLKNNFITHFMIDEEDKTLCKLFFISETMRENYLQSGDIILIDSTYNTNIYKTPLVVFSGIANDGSNFTIWIGFCE